MILFRLSKNLHLGYSWSTLLWHQCYYLHWSRDALSPVCGIFVFNLTKCCPNRTMSVPNRTTKIFGYHYELTLIKYPWEEKKLTTNTNTKFCIYRGVPILAIQSLTRRLQSHWCIVVHSNVFQ